MRLSSLQLADGTPVARLWLATTTRERMRGLLTLPTLAKGDVLLLSPCGAIHTFGMRFAIDVVFVDRDWRVVGTRRGLRPGRLAWGGLRARHTLEAAAGWLDLNAIGHARFMPPAL